MKQIIAIVKPYLAEKVLEGLRRAPLEAFSVREVKGYGRQKSYLDEYGDDQLMVISSHWGIAGCLEQRAEFASASDYYLEGAKLDPEGIMAGDLLFSAVRTACAASDSLKAMEAYAVLEEYFGEEPRIMDPSRMYLYEHKYLAPPLE